MQFEVYSIELLYAILCHKLEQSEALFGWIDFYMVIYILPRCEILSIETENGSDDSLSRNMTSSKINLRR